MVHIQDMIPRRLFRAFSRPGGLVFFSVLALAEGGGCRPRAAATGERNPYYLRAVQLRNDNRYEEAAAAFEKCLRLTPAAAEADLQLATLYDDHLDDPVRALEHYRAYLAKKPDAGNRELVKTWIVRTERRLLRELQKKYPDEAAALAPPPAAAESAKIAAEREQMLAQRIKEMNTEILALRQELRVALAARGQKQKEAAGAEHRAPPPAANPARRPVAPPRPQRYTVQAGDTLSGIARRFYGSAKYWPRIRDANREVLGGKENRLRAGMVLVIPPSP